MAPRRTDDEQLAYVRRRADEARSRDIDRDKRWNLIEQRRYRKHALNIPQEAKALGVEEIKTAFVNREINTVVGINTEAFPVVHRPPRGTSVKEQDNSSLIESWLNAALLAMDSADSGHRPYVDGSDAQAAFGLGVYRVIYKADMWDREEFEQPKGETDKAYQERVQQYKEQAPIPIVWQSLDPRTYHPFPKDGKLPEVVIIEKRRRYAVAEDFRVAGVELAQAGDGAVWLRNARFSDPYPESQQLAGSASDEIEFVQHWEMVPFVDPETKRRRQQAVVTYVADNAILEIIETGYPRLPFFPFYGIKTSSHLPEFECQSVAENIVDMVPAVDHAFTTRQAWAAFAAYAMGIFTDGPADDAAMKTGHAPDPTPIPFTPWHIIRGSPGAKFEWPQPPPVGRDLVQLPEQLVAMIKDFSPVADILRGRAEPGTPAWLGAQLVASASRAIGMLPKNHAVAFKELCQFVLWLVEHKHQDVMYTEVEETTETGTGLRKLLGLRPQDIDGYYSLSVDLNTLSQDRMIQWGQFLAGMQAQGVVSMKRTREDGIQISAPEKEEEDVLFEQYVKSDRFNQEVMDAVDRIIHGPPPPAPPQQLPAGPPNGQVPPGAIGAAGGPPPGGPMPGPAAPAQGAVPITGAPSPNAPTPGLGLPVGSPVLGPAPQGQMAG